MRGRPAATGLGGPGPLERAGQQQGDRREAAAGDEDRGPQSEGSVRPVSPPGDVTFGTAEPHPDKETGEAERRRAVHGWRHVFHELHETVPVRGEGTGVRIRGLRGEASADGRTGVVS